MKEIERHPLEPYLPKGCKILFLGSFPPQRKRWSMEFYYPNFNNDHWRIMGLVWFGDKNYFVDCEKKKFRLETIKKFLEENGIGYYDTATAVRRLADNASDKFLEVVEQTDVNKLIASLNELKAIATTGEKACTTICEYFHLDTMPKLGKYIVLSNGIKIYRLPSSSRAYPLSIEKKAEAYRDMMKEIEI